MASAIFISSQEQLRITSDRCTSNLPGCPPQGLKPRFRHAVKSPLNIQHAQYSKGPVNPVSMSFSVHHGATINKIGDIGSLSHERHTPLTPV